MTNGSANGHKPAPPHIYIGVPCHDSRWHYRFGMSIMRLSGAHKMNVTINNVTGGGIHKARNNLAHAFLTQTKIQKLLFVDTDIEFEPDFVERLMARNLPIVAGPYTHKKPVPPGGLPEFTARAIDGVLADPATGLQRVNAVGTGFLMIDRCVFEKIRELNPDLAYVEDWNEGTGETKYDFFPEGPILDPANGFNVRTFRTEDFGFCHLAKLAGFEIFVDTTFFLKHWDGQRGYPDALPPSVPLTTARSAVPEVLEFNRR